MQSVDEKILGFTNRWYAQSIDTATEIEIKSGLSVKVVQPVYFLGTKIEAWYGRGGNDIFSHDLEDVIYVLEHRSGIEKDLYDAEENIKRYLAEAFSGLLRHSDLENTLPGLLDQPEYIDAVLSKFKFIANNT